MKKYSDRILVAIGMLLVVAAIFVALFAPCIVFKTRVILKTEVKISETEDTIRYQTNYQTYEGSHFFNWIELYTGKGSDIENAKVNFNDSTYLYVLDESTVAEILENDLNVYFGTEKLKPINYEDITVFYKTPAEILPIACIILAVIVCGIMTLLDINRLSFIWSFGFAGLAMFASIGFVCMVKLLNAVELPIDPLIPSTHFGQLCGYSLGWGAILAAVCAFVAGALAIASGVIKYLRVKKQKKSILGALK